MNMANYNERFASNVPGRWYVDSSCIDCDMCRTTAPLFFRRDDEIGYSVVYRQPQTAQEIADAQEALENCPSDSIGKDGPGQPETSSAPNTART